jgi:hypothetical protein
MTENDKAYLIRPNPKQKYDTIDQIQADTSHHPNPRYFNRQIKNRSLQPRHDRQPLQRNFRRNSKQSQGHIQSHLDLDYPRYKFVVNVILGEMRGEGVK